MRNQRILHIETPHYSVTVNGRRELDKLTLNEAAALLARNEVKIDAKHLTRHLWDGVPFQNSFGFPCHVRDTLSISHPTDEPPLHLSESEFYDYEQEQAEARQAGFKTRISEVGG